MVIFKDEIVPVSGDVVVYCEKDAKPIPVGSLVSCYGSAFKDDDSFSLNFRATEKQFLSIYAERHEILEKAHSFDINALSSKARNALKGVYKKVFSERAYSMICGLVLGERDLIDNETYANFKNSGVAHALAVSGMHLAFLTTILWIILSAICPNLKLRAIFQIVLIWVFAALTGFSPSCCRAAIMLTVYHLGVIVDKEADPLTSLSLAVVICCLRNPFAILNPSLMLSASSTAGLLLLSGPILRLFPVVRGHNFAVRCVQFVFQTVAMSIAATVATFPIMVAIFQSVSLLSPVTNVFVIPAIEALFIVGVVGAATFWCPPIAFLLKYIASFLANYCAFVTGLIARLPYSTVSTERVEFWIVLLVLLVVFLLLRFFLRKGIQYILPACLLLFVFVIGGCFIFDYLHREEICVSYVYVEQGNASVISNGHEAVLIDCGGSGLGYNSIERELLYNNVKRINSVYVTHLDADHLRYLTRVINTYPVDTVYLPERPQLSDHVLEIMNVAQLRSTEVVFIREERIDDLWGLANLNVLTKHVDWNSDEENENSLVYILDYNDSEFLFTGDICSDGEERLINEYYDELNSDVLLVAHHGAEHSTSYRFLQTVEPTYAIVSVGEQNQYNLPNSMVMQRLYNSVHRVLRTDRVGTIRFIVNKLKYTFERGII